MKRVSWGTGLVIAFVVFILGVAAMVLTSVFNPTELVADDYYQRGLDYEGRIESAKRARAAGDACTVRGEAGTITIQMPASLRGPGTVTLYRPSDRSLDMSVPMAFDSSGTQVIASPRLYPGLWTAQLSWTAGGVEYYDETRLVLR